MERNNGKKHQAIVAAASNLKFALRNFKSASLMGAMLLALCLSAEAQQTKIPKIGWLAVRPASAAFAIESFRREFRALGYVEGKNFTLEYRYAENKLDRLPVLVDELIRLKVDVIVAAATNETQAPKKATGTIPIVCLNLGDPVATGFVASLARPGGNITGFAAISICSGKRLELLKETIPKLTRVAVLWEPQASSTAQHGTKRNTCARTGVATPFHGSKQRRKL